MANKPNIRVTFTYEVALDFGAFAPKLGAAVVEQLANDGLADFSFYDLLDQEEPDVEVTLLP